MRIEIMDTTLRDGEQTPGLAYTQHEKLTIAKTLLEDVKVDRIEVASANVSTGELASVQAISSMCQKWGCLDKVEVLGFADKTRSVDWIVSSGARVMNLLCKGSLNHVTNQLRKTPEQHLEDIKFVIDYAVQKNIKVNVYLEDWSNGMINSPDYVFFLVDNLKELPVMRFMLPDTLGILNPNQTFELCKKMVDKYPKIKFDFHGHNDYDMAVANSFMAIKAGFSGIHTAVNGLGERAGNTPLSSIVGVINDHLNDFETSVDETKLNSISKLIEAFSGIRIPVNKPIIGEYVFTQTCGVHADGDKKGNLYFNKLVPERFGRLRKYALGKTSGKASILKNLEELGIFLESDAIARVTQKIVELGDKKESITTEDLPFIVSDVLKSDYLTEKVKLINYYICHAQNLSPVATLKIEIDDVVYEETATGDGQYDAFMKALSKIYTCLGKTLPTLVDYIVTIPPGGKTNALVETVITWFKDREFKTRGLDSDQTASSIKATVKMLNLIEQE
ncbi:alpha-isopropylmalate synthase regulatory domain-containing protein [Pseudobacteroides cellulosolvens]|uniref:(R)-citramalate synthase n=1 Tax=Pseudobacteroides cellulosolvens ATCC 35603 = DSM 2933 TaxID=398512 RepID=A0A0L6JP21_9FIRM|nr:alpha-isopropylmalate synthase regulatory domain-containing protein [Pseudobacteroides cellulosolvens]KNY27534.1 (R)-citramalate synthase [Pseudobacteroides cellulosolvens ATCC 35603 = DSM 2933]